MHPTERLKMQLTYSHKNRKAFSFNMILILHVQSTAHSILRFPWVTNRVHFCDGQSNLSAAAGKEDDAYDAADCDGPAIPCYAMHAAGKTFQMNGFAANRFIFLEPTKWSAMSWPDVAPSDIHSLFPIWTLFLSSLPLFAGFSEALWEPGSRSVTYNSSGSNLRQHLLHSMACLIIVESPHNFS